MATPEGLDLALHVQDLRVSYGRLEAIHGVSLAVARGKITTLLGPNGAGKSTMLKTICGLLRPTEGNVLLDGESIIDRKPEQLARSGCVLVPEGRHVLATMSVRDNLRLCLAGVAKDERAERVERALNLFPVLKRYYRSSAGGLSGGEQQQLAIARALLFEPRILMLDEPSLGLAPKTTDVVFEALEQLNRSGVTMLLVEQDAGRALSISDRTYVLRSGRITLDSGLENNRPSYQQLAGAYLG